MTEFDVISTTFDDKSVAFDSILTESNAGEIKSDSDKIVSASDGTTADVKGKKRRIVRISRKALGEKA